jgi:hypothetical protein
MLKQFILSKHNVEQSLTRLAIEAINENGKPVDLGKLEN